eukprot:c247_g1_i1.p1 GENE.c247_g1_i1~~c247_g1_i1.p1  ORF type:complete len:148 (+),score=41.31 c247_g1_i1:63-446(+)
MRIILFLIVFSLALSSVSGYACVTCDKMVERLSHSCEHPMNGEFGNRCNDRSHFNVVMRDDCVETARLLVFKSKELKSSDDACLIIRHLYGNQAFTDRLQLCTSLMCDTGDQGFFYHFQQSLVQHAN